MARNDIHPPGKSRALPGFFIEISHQDKKASFRVLWKLA